MADTQRSYSELIALLADNTTGDIGAGDFRDVLASIRPPHCGIYISAQAETVISGANVWVKALGTTAPSSPDSHLMSLVGSNRIQYDGVSTRHMHIACNSSMTCAGNNVVLDLGIAKNGSLLPGFSSRKIGTGSDVGSAAVHADVSMVAGDFLEVFVRNQSTTDNITLVSGYLYVLGMFH